MQSNATQAATEAVFQALAHPARRAILSRLASGEATVTELARPLQITQPTVTHHLTVLEDAGLISRRVDGNRRPCRLAPRGVATVDRWLDMLRQALTANYDRLDTLLAGSTASADPAPQPEDRAHEQADPDDRG